MRFVRPKQLLVLILLCLAGCSNPVRVPDSDLELPSQIETAAKDRLAQVVSQTLRDPNEKLSGSQAPLLNQHKQPVYVVLRSKGRRTASAWADSGDWESNTREAIQNAILSLPGYDAVAVDTVEVCLTHSYRPLSWTGETTAELENLRGLEGLEFRAASFQERLAPTTMLEKNVSIAAAFRGFFRRLGKDPTRPKELEFESRSFRAYQLLITRYPEPAAEQMYRGSRWPAEELQPEQLRDFRDELESWLGRAVKEDGKIEQRYRPGLDRTEEDGATVREWLVTWALARAASRNDELREPYVRNLRHNLRQTYRTDGEKGFIAEKEFYPLGPLAIAGLALLEGPSPNETDLILTNISRSFADFQEQDGKLRSYLNPEKEDRSQSYYPPEALLFWSSWCQRNPDPALQSQLEKSFEYYAKQLEQQPTRESAPWFSLACSAYWEATGDSQYRDYLFQQADTVVDQFTWDKAIFPDFRGRYRRGEGVTSANATGAQILGLAQAYKAAVKSGDSERAERYRQSILRGFLYLKNLQYLGSTDLFCVREPDMVKGALRHSPVDITVRADSVAYPILALDILGEDFLREQLAQHSD